MIRTQIRYSKAGVIPPVFLAGTFTGWKPSIEMQYETTEERLSKEYSFSTSVEVEPGEHQYKLRLGTGDWWTTDETVPIVTDASGNANNVIVVKDETSAKTEPGPEHGKLANDNEPIHDESKLRESSNGTINSKSSSTTDTTLVDTQSDISRPPIVPASEGDVEETKSTTSTEEGPTVPSTDGAKDSQDTILQQDRRLFWETLISCFSRNTTISLTFAAAAAAVAIYLHK